MRTTRRGGVRASHEHVARTMHWGGFDGQTPLVGIIMGSKSDLEVMEACAAQLEEFGVPFEVVVASAHRNPERVHEWASTAAERGMLVIIAAAGKAAHLGGVVAAFTPLPVIAVPMKTSDLGGLDSLLSMVQMPTGVPVACVAINGAKNAAILATQILGIGAARVPRAHRGVQAGDGRGLAAIQPSTAVKLRETRWLG